MTHELTFIIIISGYYINLGIRKTGTGRAHHITLARENRWRDFITISQRCGRRIAAGTCNVQRLYKTYGSPLLDLTI